MKKDPKNQYRKDGTAPLSVYDPPVKKFSKSGNIIPAGATKHPKTGAPLKGAPKAKKK